MGVACPKPSKAKRLRERKAVVAAAGRAWVTLCRAVNERDKHRCRACGAFAHPYIASEIKRGHHHHIVFRSQGGKDTRANVCLLCPVCHADVHEGRMTIKGDADGILTIKRADK